MDESCPPEGEPKLKGWRHSTSRQGRDSKRAGGGGAGWYECAPPACPPTKGAAGGTLPQRAAEGPALRAAGEMGGIIVREECVCGTAGGVATQARTGRAGCRVGRVLPGEPELLLQARKPSFSPFFFARRISPCTCLLSAPSCLQNSLMTAGREGAGGVAAVSVCWH